MAQKQCVNCSEVVDEAKAFCPGCGNAFVVEEKRQDESSFESMDSTVQFGQTMYNQMLSDMGLDTKKAPEKRVEVIAPVATEVRPVAEVLPIKQVPEKPPASGNIKWLILGGLVLILFVLLILAVAVLIFMYSSRF